MGGLTGAVPSSTTRPARLPACDSSTRLAPGGGPLADGSFAPPHAPDRASATIAATLRKSFIRITLFEYHKRRKMANGLRACRELPEDSILDPVRVPPFDGRHHLAVD